MTAASSSPAQPEANTYRAKPDERGHFGQFGGRYVAETLMPLILDLDREYRAAKADPAFKARIEASYARIVALKGRIGKVAD